MKAHRGLRLAAVFASALAAGGCLSPVKSSSRPDTAQAMTDRRDLAEAVIANWSAISALAARRLLEQYGAPDEVRSGRLVWSGRGPWKRTVVRDLRWPYARPEELGVVEQTVEYPLTAGQIAEVQAFDDHVTFSPASREMRSSADREEVNYLRLNLADDVANGRTSAEQARQDYRKILALEAAGKSSPYLLSLHFAFKL